MKTNATEPQARYLTFTPGEPNPKTLTWQVILKDQRSSIGKIRWYGPYRQYSFFPYAGTVFDQTRLSDLAKFLEHQTRKHYAKQPRHAAKPKPQIAEGQDSGHQIKTRHSQS